MVCTLTRIQKQHRHIHTAYVPKLQVIITHTDSTVPVVQTRGERMGFMLIQLSPQQRQTTQTTRMEYGLPRVTMGQVPCMVLTTGLTNTGRQDQHMAHIHMRKAATQGILTGFTPGPTSHPLIPKALPTASMALLQAERKPTQAILLPAHREAMAFIPG